MLRTLVLAATLTTASYAIAAEIPGSAFRSGNWAGAAYSNDESGRFSHCVMSADYVRGETLLLSINQDGTISIGVANETWDMAPGSTIDIAVLIDRYPPEYASAEVVTQTLAVARLPGNNAVFEKIRRGRFMRINTAQGFLDFSLAGTARAFSRVLSCAVAYNDADRLQPSTSNPFTAERAGTPSSSSAPSEVDRAELLTLMTNVLSESGVSGYRILRPSETPEAFRQFPVVWSAADTIGFLTVVPLAAGQNAQSASSTLIAQDAGSCSGQFASGTAPAEDASSVRIFTACKDKDRTSKMDYTLVPANNSLYVFAAGGVFDGLDGESTPARPNTLPDTVMRKASFVVSEAFR